MKKSFRAALLVVLVLLAGAAVWWLYGARTAPSGQPPLVTLDTTAVTALRDDFNAASDDVRVILLLSPT